MACCILCLLKFVALLKAAAAVSVGQPSLTPRTLLRTETVRVSGSEGKNAVDVGATHPLWTPPKLCNNGSVISAEYYPGLRFCPPVQVQYIRMHMGGYSPPVPSDFWMLDAPAFLAVIAQREPLSKWLVNLGASPGDGEDDKRQAASGDHCTPLWSMGYTGLNLEVPGRYDQIRSHLKAWPKATIDTNGTSPTGIANKLQQYGVPRDFDFLKIDVDSVDCDFLEQILVAGYTPKVVTIETSSAWPPPLKMRAHKQCFHPLLCGCSLQMVVDIMKDYTLIQYPFEDAWLVRTKFSDMFGNFKNEVSSLYSAGNPNFYNAYRWTGDEYHKLASLKKRPQEMLEYAVKLLRTQLPDYDSGLQQGWYEVNVSMPY